MTVIFKESFVIKLCTQYTQAILPYTILKNDSKSLTVFGVYVLSETFG